MEDDKGDGEVVPGAVAGDSGGAEEPKPGEEPDGQDEDQPGKRPPSGARTSLECTQIRPGSGSLEWPRAAVATAPDDPVTFDLSVGNLEPVLVSWVGVDIAKIAKGNTFSAAWKNLIPTPDTYEEVLASAQAAHAAGAPFKNVKGRQPPEFAPEPEDAEVDDFDDESQADDQGLLSADIDPEEAPTASGEAHTLAAADDARAADALEAGGAETPVVAPAEQDEPRSAADAAATASKEANIKNLERLMAPRLIYGRYPPNCLIAAHPAMRVKLPPPRQDSGPGSVESSKHA